MTKSKSNYESCYEFYRIFLKHNLLWFGDYHVFPRGGLLPVLLGRGVLTVIAGRALTFGTLGIIFLSITWSKFNRHPNDRTFLATSCLYSATVVVWSGQTLQFLIQEEIIDSWYSVVSFLLDVEGDLGFIDVDELWRFPQNLVRVW